MVACDVCNSEMTFEEDCYHCGNCGNVTSVMKDGWALQLKDKSDGALYLHFNGDDLTADLSDVLIIKDKEKYIEFMKKHEELTFSKFGPDAICNAGYTNMMANFEFVEIEYSVD